MSAPDWEAAMMTRRSVRSYQERPIEPETMTRLREFADQLQAPFEHDVAIRFFRADVSARLYGTPAAPPPDHAAFVARTDTLSISKAGFVGELLILYATSLGLATCWYGHYSRRALTRLMPELTQATGDTPSGWGYGRGEPPGRHAICITPLAYWRKDGPRVLDRLTGALMSGRRKPLSALLEDGVAEAQVPADVRHALELARRAPSAANSQFWRFTVHPDQGIVSVAMPTGYKHFKWAHPNVDIGICACHIWLGLTLRGHQPGVQITAEGDRAVWTFRLQERA